jgi:PAS domain S-box-containing protein
VPPIELSTPAGSVNHERGPRRATLVGLACAAVLLSAVAVWVALTGAGPQPRALAASLHALIIAAPIAAGIYALRTQPAPADRFGWLLVVAGLLWSPTLLAESADSVLYSIGRVSVWLAEGLLVYVVLAYPSGRLLTRGDRLLFRSALLVVGVLYLPTALLVDQYPVPTPWSSCGSDCPPNAFTVVDSEPGFVDAFVAPLAQAAAAAIFAGVALTLARRLTRGSRLTRVGLMPVVGIAVLRMFAAAAFIVARGRSPEAQLTEVLGLVALSCVPAFSVAFVAGQLWSRRAVRRALIRLGAGLWSRPGRAELRDAIAEAVNDPSLEIAYWNSEDPGGWVDGNGERVALPRPSSSRRLTEIRGSRGRVAVLVHDAGLEHAPMITDVARGFVLMALENQRLESQLRFSLRELRASRLRILSAADQERRRIERDLHDGAQQRLVGLGIQLELAGDLVEVDPDKAAKRLRELARDVDDAVDEVRSLAHGLVPPLLVERGLRDALGEAVAGAPLTATVHAGELGRYAREIESAVYFCCLEALQNAAKHAGDGCDVSVTLWEDEELHFEVRDDGAGLPEGPRQTGAGLTNMRDRIGAVGGRLTIESAPGVGTNVAGAVPIGPIALPPQVETLLRRATDALEDCFAIYRAVRGEGGIVVDFLVEHVNEAASLDMGRLREELVGRTLGELDPAYLESEDFRWLRRVLEGGMRDSRAALAHEHVMGAGRRLRRASDMRAAPAGGGRVVVTWRDVTERTRMEEHLRLQSLVLARESEGVSLVRTSDGTIIYANQRFAQLLGYEPGELDGRRLLETIWEAEPGEAQRVVRAIAAAVESAGEARFEIVGRRKDGAAIRCEAHLVAFDHPDQGRLWVAVQQDLTDRKPVRRRSSGPLIAPTGH